MEYDYFNERPRNAIEEHRRRARYQVYVRLHIRDVYNPFDVTVECFVELYRMPQDICVELIELLSPVMQQRRAVRTTVPIHTRVLCALFYYASGSYQEHLGTSVYHAVAQSTVSNIIQEVTRALNHPLIRTRFIRFPTTHAERVETIDRHARLGLPGVLGIIDGSIMRITHPPKPHQHYYSRKHFPSLNAMIVCDVDLNILNVNTFTLSSTAGVGTQSSDV